MSSIRTFESAARRLSFKHAAAELHVSPTAVSHQIRALERHLKVTLFDRGTRQVTLTREGEALALAAHTALRELQLAVNRLGASPQAVTISTTRSFAALWLAANLPDFQRRHPDITVKIAAEDAVLDLSREGDIDMAVRYGEYPAAAAGATSLLQESVGCFASPGYWTALTRQAAATLFATRMKNPDLPSPDLKALMTPHWPLPQGFDVHYFDDENQTVQAALAGQGIAVVSRVLIGTALANGWLTAGLEDVTALLPRLHYYTVVPERSQGVRAVDALQTWLREQLGPVQTT
nr:LysR substrate-binding domain-containing protein [Parahaliea mediterranea]